MTATVFLLMIWAGSHNGFVTVPNLPSEAECARLAAEISERQITTRWGDNRGSFKCYRYEVSK